MKWFNESIEELYKNKYFYEIVKKDGHIELYGPLDLYYKTDRTGFIQIKDSNVINSFRVEEVLITDRPL